MDTIATPQLPLQGNVQSSLLGLVADYCQQQNLVVPLACQSVINSSYVSLSVWQHVLLDVNKQQHKPALGLQIAQYVQPRHVGLLAYLGLSCLTLQDAMRQLIRYNRLVYDGSVLSVAVRDQQIELSWGREAGCPGQLVDETAIALLYKLINQLLGPHHLPLASVSFINAKPDDVWPYQQFFGCPVLFYQTRTMVCFEQKWLSLPLTQPDAALQQILDQQASALLAAIPPKDDFERCLQAALVEAVHSGQVRIEPVAARLNLSVRALQRRLTLLGSRYQDRLDQVRYTLAEQYLQDPHLGLADIALLLGYSEQSAFQRAFKQWSEQTPKRWRQSRGICSNPTSFQSV